MDPLLPQSTAFVGSIAHYRMESNHVDVAVDNPALYGNPQPGFRVTHVCFDIPVPVDIVLGSVVSVQ